MWKCGLLQCRQECQPNLSAHFTIKSTKGDELSFYAYDEIVTTILKSRPFSLQGLFATQRHLIYNLLSMDICTPLTLDKHNLYMIVVILYACV